MNMKSLVQVTTFLITILFAVSGSAETANPNPLRPIDTSSPRATLQGFVEDIDERYRRTTEVFKSYMASDRLYVNSLESRTIAENTRVRSRTVQYLDLSGISPNLRDTVAPERAFQLKEILDRIDFPDFEDIPDREMMREASAKKWRLPETKIDIVLIEDGPRAGEYLVSAETVARLPDFFELVSDLPYKPGPAKELYEVYRTLSSDRARSILDTYLNSPAGLKDLVPTRWLLRLPNWATARGAGVAVWQWLGLGFGLAIGLTAILAASRATRWLARRKQDKPGPSWHRLLTPLAIILVAAFVIPRVNFLLRIGGQPAVFIAYAQTIALFIAAGWSSIVGGNIVGETIVVSTQLRSRSIDSQLIRLGTRFTGIVVAIGFLIEGANQLGLPAYSVLAGLGVGGFAVALAARDSLANLFGSIVIMFERPFRVGHWIKIGDDEGTVEDVGFRSTRIRTFYNSLISIPNNEVVNTVVDNLGRRWMRRQRFFVQIKYDTPRERVEEFVNGIKQIVTDYPTTDKDSFYIHFNGFGESGLDILLYFYLQVPDYDTELKERERVLLQILDLANAVGVEFAFPTRTLHVEGMPEGATTDDVKIGQRSQQ